MIINIEQYGAILVELNAAVTQANYAAIGAAVNAVQGIDGVSLLIDGKTPANTPTDATYELWAKAWLAVKDNPVEPEP